MSIIKAKKCEVEIQEQTDPDAACRYMVILSYEPEHKLSKEIINKLHILVYNFQRFNKFHSL